MNDIERLISGLPRPSPSPELDARISELTIRPAREVAIRARLRQFGVLAACTAGAGLIGFVLGRESAGPVPELYSAAVAPGSPLPPPGPAPERAIVNVQVPQNEAVARFVVPPKQLEGLFGRGPLEDRSGPSQLE